MTMSDHVAIASEFHPVDPLDARDPHAALADLRERCPVARLHREGLPDVVLVSRHDDALGVLRDYKHFGNMGFFPSLQAYRGTAPADRSLIELDPPLHTEARRLNLVAMKPAAVTDAFASIAARAAQLVDSLRSTCRAELVADFAVPLPADAIATVLGLPRADAPMIHEWVEATFSEPPQGTEHVASAMDPITRQRGFDEYLLSQVRERREAANPPDDAIARMTAHRRDDGSEYSDAELVIHIRTLLMAGNETTTSLLSNALFRMLSVPGAYDRLRSDPALVVPFLEECLRFDTPLFQMPRRCREAAGVGGVGIDVDEVLVVSFPSANRDADKWGDTADTFDIERFVGREPDHLAFGLGVHHCVGAYLARETARVAMEAIIPTLPNLRLADGYEYDKVWFFEFRRPKRLDVIWDNEG